LAEVVKMKDIDTAIAELARRFPEAFTAERWRPHRPLMLGTHQALCEACPDLRGTIWLALHRYTRRLMYQRALVKGASRVDLAGKPVGTVSAQHAAVAAAKAACVLARREAQAVLERERRKAKRATNGEGFLKSPTKPLGLADLKAAARRARVA
jgi:sRNA-binding protein